MTVHVKVLITNPSGELLEKFMVFRESPDQFPLQSYQSEYNKLATDIREIIERKHAVGE
jgi:hypothetical protein